MRHPIDPEHPGRRLHATSAPALPKQAIQIHNVMQPSTNLGDEGGGGHMLQPDPRGDMMQPSTNLVDEGGGGVTCYSLVPLGLRLKLKELMKRRPHVGLGFKGEYQLYLIAMPITLFSQLVSQPTQTI